MRARRGWARRCGSAWGATLAAVVLAGACATEAEESRLADVVSEAGEIGGTGEAGQEEAAAGQPADFEATARYLDKVGDQSTGEAHRIGMTVSIRAVGSGPGERLDVEAPLMTGEEDGARFEIHMDMGPWVDEMAASLGEPGPPPGMDLSMDMVGDDTTLYMRAPMFAALADEAPPGADVGPIEDLTVLADRWGRIDLTALGGFSLGELQGTMGGPAGSDPRVLLEVVAGAEDVEDLGADEIDDTAVHGLGANLSMADMVAAQGMEPEEFVEQMAPGMGVGPGGPGLDPEAAAERLLAYEMPFEVWVDGAGYVRRIGYEMDMLAMFGPMDSGIRVGGPQELVVGTTMDFWDYGDESIEIEFPADAIDVTDAYHELLRADAAAAAAAGSNPIGS